MQHGPRRELTPGQQFRGLRIHSLLNRGAMGAAYLASHLVLKMPLIVKTFVPTSTDPFSEAHLAARVSSPHIVGVIDAGYESNIPFVVQRYVDGVDLHELLSRKKLVGRTLPVNEVIHMLAEIARGLHAIHLAGVVHRDIKPANLFLSGDGRALVGDFGIALDPALRSSAGTLAGTPQFIAPEVWRGQVLDGRADIYSLGATAHLLAMGEPPFPGSTLPDLARAHMDDAYVPPPTKRPAGAYLFTVIASMLEKNPSHRPQSAEEVARVLAPVADERPALVVTSPVDAEIAGVHISLYCGDITAAQADVIVNAANSAMAMDVGVAEALRKTGGEEIEREAQKAVPVAMGSVVWTAGGRLRCRYVAHAVAAMAGAICLQRCTLRVLLEAQARGLRTLVFPALGTGVGEVPHAQAAKLMVEAMMTFARLGPGSVRKIDVALYDQMALAQWSRVLHGMSSAGAPEIG